MLSLITKTAVTTIIPHLPQIVMDSYNYLFGEEEKKTGPVLPRKKTDTTKFTQHMYDFINEEYAAWIYTDRTKLSNGLSCSSQEEFKVHMNAALNLDKSRTSYASIFNKKVDRNSLPTGTPIQSLTSTEE